MTEREKKITLIQTIYPKFSKSDYSKIFGINRKEYGLRPDENILNVLLENGYEIPSEYAYFNDIDYQVVDYSDSKDNTKYSEIEQFKLIDVLRTGKDSAISGQELCAFFGFRDRRLRREIEKLKRIYPICNSQDGHGYYIADTAEEARQQLKQIDSRCKALWIQRRPLIRVLQKCTGQTELEVS